MGEVFAVLIGALVFFVLVVDFLVALWVYADAARRGAAAPVWWAVGSFITFPAGLIAYLIDRPKGRLVPCPFCGGEVSDTETRCVFCGRGLPR